MDEIYGFFSFFGSSAWNVFLCMKLDLDVLDVREKINEAFLISE